MGEMNVDILNCVPYYPNQGSTFENIPEPSKEMIAHIRKEAGKFIPQMHHCTRCRADAVGLLGEDMPQELLNALKTCEKMPEPQTRKINASRAFVAVASREGVLVNQHLGEAEYLLIYGKKNGTVSLIESRKTPESGGGPSRWDELANRISDCSLLLVSGAGANPQQILTRKGIEVVEIEGLIHEAVQAVFDGKSLRHLTKRKMTACSAECSGTGAGCG
jgi:nitrogen fixation protein NifB